MTTATAASRLVLVPVKRTAGAPAAPRAPRRYQLARVKRPALPPSAEHLRQAYD